MFLHVGLNKVEIIYPFVIESEEQIVQLYRDAIAANPNIRLAVIGMFLL